MKFILISATIIISIILFSGCQATPDREIVVNKGDGGLEELIQSTPLNTEQAIEESEWIETYTMPQLKCEINAKVILPENMIFPVYKVKRHIFDANLCDRAIKLFTAGATGVRKSSPTKEELEQQLVQVKRGTYMFDENGGRWEPYDGQEQDIAQLEEQIKNAAPEAFDPVEDDTNMLPIDKTYAIEDGSQTYVRADTRCISIFKEKHGIVQLESWLRDGDAIPGEPPGTTVGDVNLSKEEALKTASTILSSLDIQNFGVAETDKARIVNNYTFEVVSKGWQVTLARNDGNSVPVNMASSQFIGILDFGTEEFNDRWQPEIISVYVDEDGIKEFLWTNPLEVTEILNENAPILPFDKIKIKIKDYIKFGHSRTVEKGLVTGEAGLIVDKIVLTNILVPIKDDYVHKMLAPAWLIYYKLADVATGKSIVDLTTVFAVNAIDGSSIDLVVRRPER